MIISDHGNIRKWKYIRLETVNKRKDRHRITEKLAKRCEFTDIDFKFSVKTTLQIKSTQEESPDKGLEDVIQLGRWDVP